MAVKSTIVSTNRGLSSTSSTTRRDERGETIVDLLVASGRPKAWIERKLAEMAQGIVTCMNGSTRAINELAEDLFNVPNYLAIERHGLSSRVREMFEWGMELPTVARHAPKSLPESFDEISRLANLLMLPRGRRRR